MYPMIRALRYLLFPVVPIYYLITWSRNTLYDLGIKKSTAYPIPILGIGNLSVGGTGKTPMIEYLVRLLKPEYRVATLSRGYKRRSKGFVVADKNATASLIGDEPYQFHQKFDDIIVSVDAQRVRGVSQLLNLKNPPEVILLDDAYQHRKIKAGFYILLTSYDHLYTKDIVLPTGNLREPRSGAKRANIIVVTKCPKTMSEATKQKIRKELNVLQHQTVFFSQISYAEYVRNRRHQIKLTDLQGKPFTLVTGIANPKPLTDYLATLGLAFEHLNFKDHHDFSSSDINTLKQKALIVTTEKDMMRLQEHFNDNDAVYYLPIEMTIDNPARFDKLIKDFVSPKSMLKD